jgi:hypothetical protein
LDYKSPFPVMTVGHTDGASGPLATFSAGSPYVTPADVNRYPHQKVVATYVLQSASLFDKKLSWKNVETKSSRMRLDRKATDFAPGAAFVPGATFDTTLSPTGKDVKQAGLYRIQVYVNWIDSSSGKTIGVRKSVATQAGELACATGPEFICGEVIGRSPTMLMVG